MMCLLLMGGAHAGTPKLSPKLRHPAPMLGGHKGMAWGREYGEVNAGDPHARWKSEAHLEPSDGKLTKARGGVKGTGEVRAREAQPQTERVEEDNWMESDSDSWGGGSQSAQQRPALCDPTPSPLLAPRSPSLSGSKAVFSNGWDGVLKGESALGEGSHQGFDSAWACLPHPVKAYRGGEDVRMSVTVGQVSLIGVFDGVGGWADMGVDPAMYARSMAAIITRELRRNPTISDYDERPLVTLLDIAHQELEDMQLPGTCTACLGLLTGDGQLHVLNLGDSGIQLVRDGTSVFVTNEQQHYFNCPFQLGMGSGDKPSEADYYVLEDVAPGDIVVCATDGVWDNMYEEDIVRVIRDFKGDPRMVADEIASISQRHGRCPVYNSPFWKSAASQGLEYHGGKLDDVTVVVAKVGVGGNGHGAVQKVAQQQWVDEHGSPVSSDEGGEEEEGDDEEEETGERYLSRGEGGAEMWRQERHGGDARAGGWNRDRGFSGGDVGDL